MSRTTELNKVKNLVLTSLTGKVGTYKRDDNSVVPAVWVGNDPPTSYIVTGLEIVIRESDQPEFNALLGNGGRKFNAERVIDVVLIQHDRSKNLVAARDSFEIVVAQNYNKSELILQPSSASILEQCIYRLHYWEYIALPVSR